MRLFCVSFFFLFSISFQAQDIASLVYGNTLAIDEVDIEFIEVLEDSRCPANVIPIII